MVSTYECMVSNYLRSMERLGRESWSQESMQTADSMRRSQMTHIVSLWLDEAAKADPSHHEEIRENHNDRPDFSFPDVLRVTAQTSPHSSLVWAALCLAVEVRLNTPLLSNTVLCS